MFEITNGVIQKAQRFVFYGPEGIGKSTFASRLPGVVFIDTEGSTNQLDVARFPAPTTWEMLMKEMEYAKNNPAKFGSLCIDTADWAERLATNQVCAKLAIKGIEDMSYGKGYTYVYEEFGKLLNLATEICDRGVNVGFNAHAILRKFEQPDEMGSYDRYELKLTKKIASMLKEWADLVLFANYKTVVVTDSTKTKKAQGGKRVMYTAHHPCWDAKNRHGLPDEIPMEYEFVRHVFEPQLLGSKPSMAEPTPKPTTPTAEPMATYAPTPTATVPEVAPPSLVEKEPAINYEGCPQALIDLMKLDDVYPNELCAVVTQCGFFPIDTPITAYPQDFIFGKIIPEWVKIIRRIKANRDNVPF